MAVGTLSRGGSSAPEVPDYYVTPGVDKIGLAILNTVPANGGVIRIGNGYYDETPGLLTFLQRENIRIEGIGGPTGGADTGSVIRFSQAGAPGTTLFDWADQTGCGISNLEVLASNAAFYGDVISTAGSAVQASYPYIRDCLISGTLQQILAITGATNATPIVVTTASAHGWATGDFVRIAGVGGNTAANGELLPITVVDATHFSINNSIGNGAYTGGGSVANFARGATLLNLDRSVNGMFSHYSFRKGGIGVIGKPRGVLITDATNATPIVITTAVAHGRTTGDTVRVAGVKGNTAANGVVGSWNTWAVTVIDATHLSLDGSVGNGAYVASNGFLNAESPVHFSNVHNFAGGKFARQTIMGMFNAGEDWGLDGVTAQGKEAPGALADIGFYSHSPGCWAQTLDIVGLATYDQTTTDLGAWLTFAGNGISVLGGRAAGRSITPPPATWLKIDEDGTSGIIGEGTEMDRMLYALDLGATAGTSGRWGPHSFISPRPGWKLVNRAAAGPSIEEIDTGATPGRAEIYRWNDNDTAMALQFDGDPLARLYRLSSGLLYTPSELRAAGRLSSGYGATAGSQIWGRAAETIAGILAVGSNANIDTWLDAKGTGKVKVGANAAAGGTFQAVRDVELVGVITPAQLGASVNDYAPAGLASAFAVRQDLSAAWSITGIAAQDDGTLIWLENISNFLLTLPDQSVASAALNRFATPAGAGVAVRAHGAVLLRYSTTLGRWTPLAI